MKKNMSSTDRLIRITLAILFFALYSSIVNGVLGIVLLIFGIAFLITSAIGFCPIYWIIHVSTLSSKKS
ncbi:MAG TPA: DUF2892 domain-containing protein [Candidatus Kapabacteria bacterium]|nr:DUF2892 domain-containing protein [Candidatus Kapabacteria bacterium]